MSTNGGTSWKKISSTNDSTNYFTPDDVIPVSSTVIVFAVESNGSTLGGIYRTTDGGTTWSKITSEFTDHELTGGLRLPRIQQCKYSFRSF